jgi:hypothetical protein
LVLLFFNALHGLRFALLQISYTYTCCHPYSEARGVNDHERGARHLTKTVATESGHTQGGIKRCVTSWWESRFQTSQFRACQNTLKAAICLGCGLWVHQAMRLIYSHISQLKQTNFPIDFDFCERLEHGKRWQQVGRWQAQP